MSLCIPFNEMIAIFLILFGNSFTSVTSQSDGIQVSPEVIVPGLTQALVVTCTLPDEVVSSMDTLLVLQLSKEVSGMPKPVATMVPGGGATLDDTGATMDRAEVDSTFNPTNISAVSLSVTFNLVTPDDAGTYICSASALNKLHVLTKSEYSATVIVKPLVSLNVFDLATALAQLANSVANLEKILKTELYKRDALEKQVEGLTQRLATLNSTNSSGSSVGTSSGSATLTSPAVSCDDNTTSSFQSNFIENYTDATDERLKQLEQRLVTVDNEMSALKQQQAWVSQLGNDSAAYCADVENVCVSIIKAKRETVQVTPAPSQVTQMTPLPVTTVIPKLVNEEFPLLNQVNLRDLPDYPVASTIDLTTLTIPRAARAVMFHLSACVVEDNDYTEAEKVSLEAFKVSHSGGGALPDNKLGICLGYPQTESHSGIIGRRSAGTRLRGCVCRPDATLLQDVHNSQRELSVDLTWVGNSQDTKDSLEVCVVSQWSHDLTRRHAHLGPQCTAVRLSYFTIDS